MKRENTKGIIYAILAAFCNSWIGIFSSILIEHGLTSIEIAFMRCFVALVFTFLFCMINTRLRGIMKVGKSELIRYAILAFVGIHIMYLFETTAVQHIPVSLVSFLLYASGIVTIILSCIFLKEQMTGAKIVSVVTVFSGIVIMFFSNVSADGNVKGIVFAIIAGTGYSLYLFLNKKWNIRSGMKTLLYIFLFGTIYLGVQLLVSGTALKVGTGDIPLILLLTIVPTMGGFYFTNKALSCTTAGEVQLAEMSEPFFAALLGLVILNQVISKADLGGGILIVIGLLILEKENIGGKYRT